MEKKKQLLIKVLTKLKPHRNLADGFLALLESKYITDEIMDKLIGALQEAIETVKAEKEKDTFKKGLKLIKKIRSKEEQEMKMTDEELEMKMTDEELDKLLDTV